MSAVEQGTNESGTPPVATTRPTGVEVVFTSGEAYTISVREHRLTTDQPLGSGGRDEGPTPVELFVASLAGCVAYYAGRFLERHHLAREGLLVRAEFDMADDRPARVAAIRVRVNVPGGLSEVRRAALHAVVRHCTVHNSLRQPPEVRVDVVDVGD
ncbi:OsmC family protein [Streptomyces sp. Q6]|uniref:OsmC family protein n=1 Tax=Streptomyces citrinus TaxID=3118173 RepID=A0ACD5AM66_9ACTN